MTKGIPFSGGKPLPDRSEPTDDWMPRGACRAPGIDRAIFFPGQGESLAPGRAVCAACQVREKCGKYAFDNDERFGIWGGMSEKQRRNMRRTRRIAALPRVVGEAS